MFGADSADLSISKLPDLPSSFDKLPGEPSPEPRDILICQTFLVTDPGPGKFSPEPGGVLEWPDFASDVDPRPGKFSPESGDLLELPDFACDYDNYFFHAQYDVDSPDYSDYDEPGDLDGYSDVYGFVGVGDCHAPTDVDFMHALHGPDNCEMYCQLRYNIRPYGHYAPTDVEFYHGMHGPENCGEKCVTQSDGESDIYNIYDIGDIL